MAGIKKSSVEGIILQLPGYVQLCCGPYGPTASIFYGIWIKQIGAMVFIFNLDKVLLKKLFPTMNI